jgi:N-acetyl-gamma-glutamyl-phosphate reductase
VQSGIISPNAVLSCFSLTGYSGGGKPMIAEYEGDSPPRGARPYALGLTHKHSPEMKSVCGLENAPIFMPVLAPVRQGMLVSVPLATPAMDVYNRLSEWYGEKPRVGAGSTRPHVTVKPFGGGDCLESGRLDMEALNGTDDMELFVFGHETQTVVTARFDNLGKGASGAAVQCLMLRFGIK